MKNLFSKLMMVLLIALFALPAQADFWVTGNEYYAAATGGKKWDEGLEPKALTKIDNSHFTLTMTVSQENYNHPIIVRIAASDSNNWDTFNGKSWGVTAGQTDAINENGSTIKPCGGETNLQFTPASAGTYILDISNVDWDNKKTAVAKIIKQSSSTTASVIGYVTDADNWNSTGVALTDNGDGTASGKFTLYKEYFRIKVNGSQYGPAVNPTDITLGSAMDYTPQDYNSWKLATGTYNIVVDNNTKKVTVTAQGSVYKYYVKYTTNNWSSYVSEEMERQSDGTYTYTLTDPKTSWQLAMQDNSKNDFWTNSEDNTYTGGTKSFTMEGTYSKNILFGEGLSGKYTLTYDPSTKKLTIDGGSTPTPSTYSYQLHGTIFDGSSWQTKDMTKNEANGAWEWTGSVEAGNFGIKELKQDGNQNAWISADDGATAVNAAGVYAAKVNGSDWISTLVGECTFSFNPETMKLTISGGEAYHKPYYFVGDMNDWFSKEFTDPTAHIGMDKDVMNANKKDWEFKFIDEIPGKTELGKGWYEFDIECLTGQFQIFDGTDAMWNGDVYSHDPYVRGYGDNGGKDHESFKAYINRPISKTMISEGLVMTKTTTTGGNPAIRRSSGSNFHLGCNAVRNAKIYFLPGDDPKLIVSGTPEDYYIFYSKVNKTLDADGKVTAQIVNGKPNTNNYYLPGVKYDNVALPNFINEDGTTAAHMNMEGVDLVEFDFSANKIATTLDSKAFKDMFGADDAAMIGNVTLAQFKQNLKADTPTLPNGISLTGRTTVYVQKIPNGFEYPAGRKYALQFINAFSSSDKGVLTPVAASNLYFFNDAVHVHFNIDNYEKGAQEKDRFVKMYYRIYTYDENYNTVVINTDDGTKKQIHSKGEEIGLTAGSTTKDLGWVALNEKKAPTAWNLTAADTGYPALAAWNVAWVNDNDGRKNIDSKYGNCYIQFKIETGPNASQASVANRANAEESNSGTLYIPERALIRNTPEFYTFNGKDLYVALDGGYTTTDVEDVFEDQIVEEGVDAEPIFFNLQGQRVVNPEKGMYIVVKGNKTYKVMIK